ncbi:hypothetical protein F0562_006583 [Nyssa sinensis]|uniref:Uncharacterized protein n=1 Tax=Nyssa sinensis TaxID=561372 RepID=A0A5J5ALU3_9ASTE|nr:hypothetical protein F0562_006583 [Nyssa sinensis]
MVFNPPWRLLSVSGCSRNLLPTLYSSFVTLSSPSNLPSLANKQSSENHSVHNSTRPHGTDFIRLLNLCRNVEDLKPLKSLLITHGLIGLEPLVGEFVRLCFHLGAPELALSTFERLVKPSVLLQNLIIRCLCNDELFEHVLCIYQNCRILGFPSDNYTFPFVIKACSALGAFQIGKAIHCVVLRTGFGDNLIVQTAFVDLYAKIGRTGTARLLLDRISQPDLVPWNALISGYSLNGLNQDAFEVLLEICEKGLKPNVSTLASIIPICTRSGNLDIGKSLHSFALKSGFLMDESLAPALISLYAGCGDLSVARTTFDCLQKKNVTVWNAMISAYTQNQKSSDAFKLFRRLLQDDEQPNAVTFVSIIPSCENFGGSWCGESLHACVIKEGLENQLSVVTALLSMYAKLGDLDSARFLFDQMAQRNLLSWNSMISGYVHNGLWDASLDAFREMQFEGINPDAVSVTCILSACAELGAILLGKSAHGYSLKRGFDMNLTVSNALLAFYSNCHQLSFSFKIFRRMVTRNSVSWNTLISGSARNGEANNAVALLHQMQQEGMNLDLVTLISVLPCYSETESLVQGMAIHGYAIKMGYASDVSLSNALISMYFNCGELDVGKLLFEVMPNRSVVSWNALITGYRYHNVHEEVMVLFGQMIKEDQKPNYVTLLNILPMCYTQLQGKSIHAYASRTGNVLEAPLLTSLILMYARFENINSCLLLFDMGKKRNISLWNAIMSVHVQRKNAKKAVGFFYELLQMQMEPDYVTVLNLISACSQLNNLNLTNAIMAYVIHNGFDKDVVISNALIDLYARCGNISIARKIFDEILEKDAISWSVMINAHGLHGDGEAALALLSQMQLLGMKPDDITYLSILSACSHAGLVVQGQMIFNSMVAGGILPRMEHYACMVDLLGRTGHVKEANCIVKNMPHGPSESLLESLLGACIVHGNVEIGEEIGKLLLEMDPKNSGSYVMLYNLYATAGRWTDANKVRSNMEDSPWMELSSLVNFSRIAALEIGHCDGSPQVGLSPDPTMHFLKSWTESWSLSFCNNNGYVINKVDFDPDPLQFLISNLNSIVTIKLDSTNYLTWKAQISAALDVYDLLGYVDGSIPMPSEQIEVTVGDAAQRVATPRFTEWKRADRHLQSAINATIHPSLLPHVVNLKHAFEVWNVLEKRMNSTSRSHIMQLRNDLQRVKKDSAKPMKDYLDKVKQITDKLVATSNTIFDEEIVLVILKGLPREYMSFKTTIKAREASITVEELSNLLLSEEINISMEELELNSQVEVTTAFSAQKGQFSGTQGNYQHNKGSFRGNVRNGRGFNRGRGNFNFNRSNNGRGQWSYNSNFGSQEVRCQICNKPRHTAKDCWYRTDLGFQPQPTQALIASSENPPDAQWFFDSGATHHVTSNVENLQQPEH